MMFGALGRVTKNLCWGSSPPLHGKGQILGVNGETQNVIYRENVTWTMKADPIKLPFGMVTGEWDEPKE